MPDRPRRPLTRLGLRPAPPPRTSLLDRATGAAAVARRSITHRPAPLVVALIVLVASAASVPAAAGMTGYRAETPAGPRLTLDDPVTGPAAAATDIATRAGTLDQGIAVGGPATGGTPADPWVFTPLVIDAGGGDMNDVALRRPSGPTHKAAITAARASMTRATPATKSIAAHGFAPLLWPVPGGYVSQGFGCTGVIWEPPFGSCPHYHTGIDIAAHEGAPILAAAAGTVVFAGWQSNGGGYQVWVSDGGNMYTGYHHMSSVGVFAGERIRRGQRIGAVGMTGNATGPHCHFMVSIGPFWAGGRPVDPRRYL